MNTLFSIYVWLVWSLHILVNGTILALLLLVLPPMGRLRAAQLWVGVAFFFAGIRVRAVGLERVDWTRAHVFMANHESLLDHFAVVLALPAPLVGIEKHQNFRVPVYGWMVKAWGNIPIVRDDPAKAREAIAVAARTVQAGMSILIMPEGTRSRNGELAPFKKGGFHLAMDIGADIVPITINGAYELSPGADWRVRPGLVEIVFADPIPTAGLSKDQIDELVRRVRDTVAANMRPVGAAEPAAEAAA